MLTACQSEPAVNDPDWELVRRNPTFCGGFPDLDLVSEHKGDGYSRNMIESQIGDDYEVMSAEIEPEIRITERKKGSKQINEGDVKSDVPETTKATDHMQKLSSPRALFLDPRRLTTTKVPKGRTWYFHDGSRLLNDAEILKVGEAILGRAEDKYLIAPDLSEARKKYYEDFLWQSKQFREVGQKNGAMYDLD